MRARVANPPCDGPCHVEQAKPDGPPVFFIRQDGTHGEYPPPDECSCPQHGGWVTAKRRAEQAEAKLALAEQDARRLDALEGIFHREGTAGGYSRVSGGIDISIEIGGREFVGDTLRAAIDASQD